MEVKRKPLSKKTRFEIFKRDHFTCQYCGRKPPDVVLAVDHVIPVVAGGHNAEHNLLTACADCNNGKGPRGLDIVPARLDLIEKRRLIEERREQLVAYEGYLTEIKNEDEDRIDSVIAVYDYMFENLERFHFHRSSIRNFLKLLPLPEVQEAMEIACERVPAGRVFSYFCGVCWQKIRAKDGLDG